MDPRTHISRETGQRDEGSNAVKAGPSSAGTNLRQLSAVIYTESNPSSEQTLALDRESLVWASRDMCHRLATGTHRSSSYGISVVPCLSGVDQATSPHDRQLLSTKKLV